DPVPIFAQLVNQVKQAVLSDELQVGSTLPSIRQLASELNLNHKTVAKAYRILERDSVIETKGYRGTFIHSNAKANSSIDLNQWASAEIRETIKALRESGVTDSEIRIAFRNEMNIRL
ncbi:GntR family transcriptional regulator, partial [candidate division KSB1 bacterium]